MTVKDLSYATTNNLYFLYLIFNKLNGYIEEINYFKNYFKTLVPTDQSKDSLKKYEELWDFY